MALLTPAPSRALAWPSDAPLCSYRTIIEDGSPIPQQRARRNHLYVSFACPWAHRTLMGGNLPTTTATVSPQICLPIQAC